MASCFHLSWHLGPQVAVLLQPSSALSFFLQDSLALGRSEQPHPICSFQDDFQEFEMIDDNEEEEEEEEEEDEEEEDEEEGEGEGKEGGGPGSETPAPEPLIPSPSLEEPHKHRPTTLHLTTLGAQVSSQAQSSPWFPAWGALVPMATCPLLPERTGGAQRRSPLPLPHRRTR